jgi:hypothetical protein
MRKLALLSILFSGVGFAQWSNGYTYKATFVVQPGKVTGTQANFTAVVAGTATGLKTVANSGHVQNTCTQTLYGLTVPADLIFTSDSAGTTLLKWQFDTYNASSGAYSAHVLMTSIDTSANNTLYMWYGKSSATTCQGGIASAAWDANTQSALVLPNGTTLNTSDYLGNTVTTDSGGVAAGSGLNSGAAVFNNSSASSPTSDLQIAGRGRRSKPLTACIWEKTTSSGGSFDYMAFGDHDSSGNYSSIEMRVLHTNSHAHTTVYDTTWVGVDSAVAVNNGAWHQVCQVATSTGGANGAGQLMVYVDGAASGTPGDLHSAALSSAGATYAAVGRPGGYVSPNYDGWNGSLAEFTLDNTARSSNWIAARYNNVSSPPTFWLGTFDLTSGGGGGTFSIAPAVIPNGHAGNITLTLAGSGTSWGGTTVVTASGVANVSCGAVTVTSTTAATVACTTGAGTGTLTLTESVTGTATAQTAVSVPSLSLNLTRGTLNSVQTLTLTGSNTVWSQETAAGLFTVSGGTGASIGTPTITTNTAGTVALTVGTAAGTLTITDASTGKTATFAAGASGGGTCAVVSTQ